MKNTILLLFLMLFISCKKEVTKTIIQYSDSTYKTVLDSIPITEDDTLFKTKTRVLTGFFKIADSNGSFYSIGKLVSNKKTGKWSSFTKNHDGKFIIYDEINYNSQGELHGDYILYEEGKPFSVRHYSNDEKFGLQEEFYSSGKLHYRYETDEMGNSINNYIVYDSKGDTLYHEDFGSAGTGYMKFYDQHNNLEWEGKYVNKKREGWHKDYLIAYGGTIPEYEKTYYMHDSLAYRSTVFNENYDFQKKEYRDSIVYNYLKNEDKTESIYYYKGKVIKKHIE